MVKVEERRGKSFGYVVSIPNLKITSRKICLDPALGDPHWGKPDLSDYRMRQILKAVRDETGSQKGTTPSHAKRKPQDGTKEVHADWKKLLAYIEALESTNEQLVFALKKCLIDREV